MEGFCKDFIETGNATEAARRNYNCRTNVSAANLGCIMLKHPKIKEKIERKTGELELTEEMLLKKAKEGLDANVVSSYRGDVKETEIADLNIRHKYWQDLAKILRMFPAEQIETKNLNIDLELSKMPKEEFLDLLKGLIKQINEPAKKLKIGIQEGKEGSSA